MAKSKSESPFVLENVTAMMGKISNNLLSFGDDKVTAFTLPFDGIELTAEQLDRFLGKYTHRSWYDHRRDGTIAPMSWWAKRKNGDFSVEDEFDCEDVTLLVSGDRELEFESEPHADGDGETPAARITKIVLVPQQDRGLTHLSFHMQVRPGLGQTNLALQEHQNRPVRITLGATTLAVKQKGGEQTVLEFGKEPSAPILDGSHIAAAMNGGAVGLASLKTAVDAVVPSEVESRVADAQSFNEKLLSEIATVTENGMVTHAHESFLGGFASHNVGHPCGVCDKTQPELNELAVNAAGTAASPHTVIDTVSTDPVDNGMDPDLESDIKRFEEGAAQNLKEFTSVSQTGAIDGRSERVKHEDRQRGRGRRGLQ